MTDPLDRMRRTLEEIKQLETELLLRTLGVAAKPTREVKLQAMKVKEAK